MYHGSENECELMLAEAELVPLLDLQLVCNVHILEEIVYHCEGLGVAHNDSLGILVKEVLQVSGVVRFHVVNDDVIWLAVTEHLRYIAEPLVCEVSVNCIADCYFLILNILYTIYIYTKLTI